MGFKLIYWLHCHFLLLKFLVFCGKISNPTGQTGRDIDFTLINFSTNIFQKHLWLVGVKTKMQCSKYFQLNFSQNSRFLQLLISIRIHVKINSSPIGPFRVWICAHRKFRNQNGNVVSNFIWFRPMCFACCHTMDMAFDLFSKYLLSSLTKLTNFKEILYWGWTRVSCTISNPVVTFTP